MSQSHVTESEDTSIEHLPESEFPESGESDSSTEEPAREETAKPAEPGFADFNLAQPLMRALQQLKFRTPTPVQSETIPVVAEGRDVLSTAQTGTGKTAAFALPIMNRKLKGDKKQTLILAPTRELALQIHQMILDLGQFAKQIKSGVVIGGAGYTHQARLLSSKPTFVIGTPGRLIDQLKLGNLKLENFGTLVLDEADRLLDMGFEPQIEEIVAHFPTERQTLLFSATLPKQIENLARRYMRNPARVSIGAVSKPVDRIRQNVIETTEKEKPKLLISEIDKIAGSIIVFTKTKFRTESVARNLSNAGHDVARIHGGRSQSQRNEAIRGFREGKYRILVATDIAARGIDIPHVRHVVNYDLPLDPDDYIHRIGRTARAGADGDALAFLTPEERLAWAKIYRLMYGKWPEDSLELAKKRGRAGRGAGKPEKKASGQKQSPPKAGKHSGEHKAAQAKQETTEGLNRAERRAKKYGQAVTERFRKKEREQDAFEDKMDRLAEERRLERRAERHAKRRAEFAEAKARGEQGDRREDRRHEQGDRPSRGFRSHDRDQQSGSKRGNAWNQSEIFGRKPKRGGEQSKSFGQSDQRSEDRRSFGRDDRQTEKRGPHKGPRKPGGFGQRGSSGGHGHPAGPRNKASGVRRRP